jgi:hypothetical protein
MQGYITGRKKELAEDDPNYEEWEVQNALRISWLNNSIEPQIAKRYLTLDSAEKVWKALKGAYSQAGNDARAYDLTKKIVDLMQGEMTVSQYFEELSSLWQEIDMYDHVDCVPDCRKKEEKHRI